VRIEFENQAVRIVCSLLAVELDAVAVLHGDCKYIDIKLCVYEETWTK